MQVLSFLDHFGIADDDPRVNLYGGAIANRPPAGGVRRASHDQLARQFSEHPEVRYGLTAMCVGLGQGGSVVWETRPGKASRTRGRLPDDRPRRTLDLPRTPAARSPERWHCSRSTPATRAGRSSSASRPGDLEAALDGAERLVREEGVVAIGVTGVNHVFCAGRRPQGRREHRRPRGQPRRRGPRPPRPAPVRRRRRPDVRVRQRPRPRRRAGDGPALHVPDDLRRRARHRAARGVPRARARLGRDVPAPPPGRSGRRGQGRHRERAREQQDALRPAGLPGRHRRRAVRARPTSSCSRCAGPGRSRRARPAWTAPNRRRGDLVGGRRPGRGRRRRPGTGPPPRRTGRSTSRGPRARTTGHTHFTAEDQALADLGISPELKAGLYAFDLVQRYGRKPTGAPQVDPRQVTSVGVVGAGPHGLPARAAVPAPVAGPRRPHRRLGRARREGRRVRAPGRAGPAGQGPDLLRHGQPAVGLVSGSVEKSAWPTATSSSRPSSRRCPSAGRPARTRTPAARGRRLSPRTRVPCRSPRWRRC